VFSNLKKTINKHIKKLFDFSNNLSSDMNDIENEMKGRNMNGNIHIKIF